MLSFWPQSEQPHTDRSGTILCLAVGGYPGANVGMSSFQNRHKLNLGFIGFSQSKYPKN